MRLFTIVFLLFGIMISSSTAQDFYNADVVADYVRREGSAVFLEPAKRGSDQRKQVERLPDGVFVHLNFRVVIDQSTVNQIRKMVDQGFTDEPSGCAPGAFGPLDMEEDLRYFFGATGVEDDIGLDQIRYTVYPGARSTHWANNVYCEFDETRGRDEATIRFSGYYYVSHRRFDEGLDVLMSAIPVNPEVLSQ